MAIRFNSIKTALITAVCVLAFAICQSAHADTYWAYTPDSNLITTAAQISTNSIQNMSGDALSNLLDGNVSTWYHSAWNKDNGSSLPDAEHYLQVHLNQPQTDIIFTFTGMDWPSAHNSPNAVTILATNTPNDESTWTEIVKLDTMIPADNYPVSYTSPHIPLGQAYTDIRMVVNKTTTMNRENTYGRYFFCLSEFGIYKARQTDSIPAPDPQQVNIAFIGNSITYGATLSNPTTQCPPRRVQEILQAQGLTVNYINCAVSGYTTFHFIPTGTRHAYVVDAIKKLSKNPGKLFVLIMLGTNDSAESGTLGAPVSTSTYYNNMKTIVDDIFSYNKDANVILNYPIWYSPNTHNGATYLQGGLNRLKSYHPVIDSLVNYYQTRTVRRVFAGNKAAFTFFENNTAYLTAEPGYSGTFYLHPNAEGAKRLANFWAASILQHLSDTARVDHSAESYALLDSATQTVSDCYEYAYDANANMLTDASQLSCNAGVASGSALANLLDSKLNSWFGSDPSSSVREKHYLQADLKNDTTKAIVIGFLRRFSSKDGAEGNLQPVDISLFATNDTLAAANGAFPTANGSFVATNTAFPTANGSFVAANAAFSAAPGALAAANGVLSATNDNFSAWDHITGFHSGMPAKNQNRRYYSPLIITAKPYRFWRMVVNANVQDYTTLQGTSPFNLSEFCIIPAKIYTISSPYYGDAALSSACNELTALVDSLARTADLKAGLSREQKSVVEEGIARVRAQKDFVLGLKSCQSAKDETVDVYDTAGRLLYKNIEAATIGKRLKSGIYIVGNKKIVVR